MNEADGLVKDLRVDTPRQPGTGTTSGRPAPAAVLAAGAVSALAVVGLAWAAGAADWLTHPGFRAWQTVCVTITVQALPFLILGTLISGAVNAFVPAHAFSKALPRNPVLAVPVASAAGIVLPGCECASVPVAGSLIRRGGTPAAAFAFLLSAPAVNPIVLTATAVAFPGKPEMVAARLIASFATSAAMGWLWLKLGRAEWLRMPARHTGHQHGHSRWEEFRLGFQHDFLHAGGFLVLGAMAAATPRFNNFHAFAIRRNPRSEQVAHRRFRRSGAGRPLRQDTRKLRSRTASTWRNHLAPQPPSHPVISTHNRP